MSEHVNQAWATDLSVPSIRVILGSVLVVNVARSYVVFS